VTRGEIVFAIVSGLLVNEFCDISPWVALRLVRWAARLRYRGAPARAAVRGEELAALMQDRPGNLFKLLMAVGFALHALLIAALRSAPQAGKAAQGQRRRLEPGEPWPDPPVGIGYTLMAGGKDIRYSRQVRPGRLIFEEHRLSDHVGRRAAARLAKRLVQIKGQHGGRVYITEGGEFFAPIANGSGTSYVYLGSLGDDPWFPALDVPRA
jgi:hypothetical protein